MDPNGPSTAPPSAARVPLPDGLSGWMSFVGFITLLYGGIQVLTCVGAIQGILLLVAGVAVLGAKNALGAVDDVDASLAPFFAKLKTAFVMTGIGYIVTLAIVALVFMLYFGAIMAVLAGEAWR